MNQACDRSKSLILFFVFTLLMYGVSPAQKKKPSANGAENSSGPALERLTIQFSNGTPDAEATGSITGVVFDYDTFQSSKGSGQSSLLEQLKQHGTGFKTAEKSVEVELKKPIKSPMLVVIYKDGIYQKQLEPESSSHSVKMTVYEPTRNKDAIRIQRHHIPLQRHRNKLQVSEVLVMKNTGNRTYVGPEGYQKSIPITLPAEAHNVKIGGVTRQPDTGAGGKTKRFWLSKTLSPDRPVSARLRYHLPLEGGVTLERTIDYLTGTFFFAAGEDGLKVVDHSDNLSKETRSSPDGKGNVVQLSARNLSPDQVVSVTLEPSGSASGTGMGTGSRSTGGGSASQRSSGGSNQGTQRDDSMDFGLVLIGVLAGLSLLVSFVAILFIYRSFGSDTSSPEEPGRFREILMEEIARLDQDLEEGKISEEYHEQRRERLKSRLMDLEKDRLS